MTTPQVSESLVEKLRSWMAFMRRPQQGQPSRVLTVRERDALEHAVEDAANHIEHLQNEVERLRARTKEIQQQEMAKRAAMESELQERRNAYDRAWKWTEDRALTADWAADPSSPFWGMTSTNAREVLAALFLDVVRMRQLLHHNVSREEG